MDIALIMILWAAYEGRTAYLQAKVMKTDNRLPATKNNQSPTIELSSMASCVTDQRLRTAEERVHGMLEWRCTVLIAGTHLVVVP